MKIEIIHNTKGNVGDLVEYNIEHNLKRFGIIKNIRVSKDAYEHLPNGEVLNEKWETLYLIDGAKTWINEREINRIIERADHE